jgi:hypothetical protein
MQELDGVDVERFLANAVHRRRWEGDSVLVLERVRHVETRLLRHQITLN